MAKKQKPRSKPVVRTELDQCSTAEYSSKIEKHLQSNQATRRILELFPTKK
jgi:hypothetical protein